MRQLSNTMRNFRLLGTGICLLTGYLVYFHWPRMTNLPVYFSVLFLLNLGLLCWITNLYILNVSGIPTKRLLGLTVDTVPSVGRLSPSGSPGAGIYSDLGGLTSLNLTLTTVSLVSFLVFLAFETVHGEERAEWIPLWTYIGLGAFFLNPWPIGYYKERLELSRALKRIALGGLSDPVPFCDVLFADIMTSFSRVFGDLKWIMADLLLSIDTETALAGRIWIEILVPLLISLPYAFRLRQCLAEAHQTKDSVDQKRHYLNAIKYLSAFPVVLASFWINHLRSIYASEEIKDSVSVSQTLNIAVALWYVVYALTNNFPF